MTQVKAYSKLGYGYTERFILQQYVHLSFLS